MNDNFSIQDLEQFLNDLTKTKKGKKIIDDLEYWTPKYIGNGLYQIGDVITGLRGLEELDKAIIDKVKKYESKSN